jgi:hypothetical protein
MPTNYTFNKLYGAGTSSIDLVNNASYTFTITNNSGSSYFVMETISNSPNQLTPKNTSGSFSSLTNVSGLVISDYIAGFTLPQGISSFDFVPSIDVSGVTLKLRGTGGITLSIGDPVYVSGSWILISQLWNNVTSSWNQPII